MRRNLLASFPIPNGKAVFSISQHPPDSYRDPASNPKNQALNQKPHSSGFIYIFVKHFLLTFVSYKN